MCCDREQRECGFADVVAWWMSDAPGPIKPKDVGVVWLNNSLVTSPPASSILAMSLVNNRVFERSMGH